MSPYRAHSAAPAFIAGRLAALGVGGHDDEAAVAGPGTVVVEVVLGGASGRVVGAEPLPRLLPQPARTATQATTRTSRRTGGKVARDCVNNSGRDQTSRTMPLRTTPTAPSVAVLAEASRLAAIRACLPLDARVRLGGRDGSDDGASGADVVVVDAGAFPLSADLDLDQRVRSGALLVDLGAVTPLAEPAAGSPMPTTEWFVTLSEAGGPWGARLGREWPVTGPFTPLDPRPGAETLATVNAGFADRPVLCRRQHGAGVVVTCAFTEPSAGPQLRRLLARLVAGRGRHPAPTAPLGLAIVGYGPLGGMGLHHGLGASAVEGVEFVAVCDAQPDRLKAAVHEFPGISTYDRPEELARDAGVDVVVVATPPSSHPELSELFLRAGKHVVVEKPLCFTPAQADRLISIAADGGVVLTVHHNRRWDPDFLAVQSVVRGGELGDVWNVETFVGGFEHPCRAWHSERSISGGAIYDWGAHYLDWTLLLLGSQPVRVSATGHKRVWHDVTNEDQVRVRLGWADGREAEFVHSDVAAVRRPKWYVQGTHGTLVGHYRPVAFESIEPGIGYRTTVAHHAEAPADLTLATYSGAGLGLRTVDVPLPAPPAWPFHTNLADHLLLGEPLAVTAEQARSVITVLDAAQRSLDAGGEVVALD